MNRLWVRFSLVYALSFLLIVSVPTGLAIVLFSVTESPSTSTRENQLDENFPHTHDEDINWRTNERRGAGRGVLATFLSLTCLASIIGMIAGVWISRQMSKPLTQLVEATEAVRGRDFSYRIEKPKGADELKQLATAFNGMAHDLELAETLRQNLMADVAHELRTPLTVLEGNLLAALENVYALDEEGVATLYQQTRHLTRLVADLHELAQAEAKQLPLDKTAVDLRTLLQEVITFFRLPAQEEAIALVLTVPDTPTIANIDSQRIRQVLHNLLANALRHTPKDGQIQVTLNQEDTEINLHITDTGEGIAPADLPRLFNRFYRADRSRSRDTGGTGLGLAIVKAILSAHDGTITAYSAGQGQGTTFTVTLPVHHDGFAKK